MKTRNINLDLIKCIACIAVVGLHSVGMINYTFIICVGAEYRFFSWSTVI